MPITFTFRENPEIEDRLLNMDPRFPWTDARLIDGKTNKIKKSVERPIIPGDSNEGDMDGPGPKYVVGNTSDPVLRYENEQRGIDHTKLYGYYKHRFLVGFFNVLGGRHNTGEFVIIRTTDENYNQINIELEELFSSSDGLTCNVEYKSFFFIDSKQPILNQDIQTLINNKTNWEVKTYSFETFSFNSLNRSTQSSHQVTSKIEEVLPIGEFDKIWSYSYYSEKLEENA